MQIDNEKISRLTIQFARSVCTTLKDMMGLGYSILENTLHNEPFSSAKGIIAFVYFSGAIQGNCILNIPSDVYRRLTIIFQDKAGLQKVDGETHGMEDVIGEMLNISVGLLMPSLEKEIEAVTCMSPVIISGKTIFPKIASNSIKIDGDAGPLTCVVSLNMIRQKITQTLQSLAEALAKKSEQVYIDSLTGLKNRRYFDEVFPQLVDSCLKTEASMSILIIDLDNFKSINDLLGHQIGDQVLSIVAQSIAGSIREMDIACRYGGDEIVVILPDAILKNAVGVAERIRNSLNRNSIKLKEQINILTEPTISIGVAQAQPGDSCDQFFKKADAALYYAKRKGRNCIETLPSSG